MTKTEQIKSSAPIPDGPFTASAPKWQSERFAAGVAARKTVPFSAQGEYTPDPHRAPLSILTQQNLSRVQDLVPLRMFRMTQDAFAFFRGAAAIMASDLSTEPISGGRTFVCGDAHINNFGVYDTPEGRLVFDVNDFDESTIGPWEWDLKRMATSVVLAGRERNDSPDTIAKCTLEAVLAYQDSLHEELQKYVQDRFFHPTRAAQKEDPGPKDKSIRVGKALSNTIKAAKKRTDVRAAEKMTHLTADGRRLVIDNPPVLTPLDPKDLPFVKPALDAYLAKVRSNIALFMSEYKLTDVARRVVGVGSVGTRCYAAVFTGPDGEPFVLQLKQAVLSALVQYGKQEIPDNPILVPELTVKTPGYRVVQCQRALQEVPDQFLSDVELGNEGFYVRQFRDENAGIDVPTLSQSQFLDYVRACGAQLGRAHSRSKDGAFAAGYMGTDTAFGEQIAKWAHAYADQSEKDYEALKAAVKAGRFPTMDIS